MNSAQLQERLRSVLKRRIERGLSTGTSLALQTGLRPSHISNFLHRKRNLSMAAFDRLLAAQSLTLADLAPSRYAARMRKATADGPFDDVPLVSPSAAAASPSITSSLILEVIQLPAGILESLGARRSNARRNWQRFVAVRLSPDQALPMAPILRPLSIVVLDRHYRSLVPYRPPQPNVYGVNDSNALIFRYVSSDAGRLILRPYAIEHPVKLIEIDQPASVSDHIVGRVCVCISQL